MNMTTISYIEAKQHFAELINGTEERFDRYLIIKNGKKAAVVLSAEEYESLLETLDILFNKREVKRILEGVEQVRKGETIPFDQFLMKEEKNKIRKRRH